MVECVHQLAVSGIASIHGVELSDQAFERFATFLPRERRALQMFAPYAARFVPGVLGNFDKLAAGAFLLFWAMSLARSYKSISKLAKPPEPETPAPATPVTNADDLLIGATLDADGLPTGHFPGLIDEVRLSSRALAADELLPRPRASWAAP